jgi:hypothetical protein
MNWYSILQRWSFTEMAKEGSWSLLLHVRARSLDDAKKTFEETYLKNRYRKHHSLRFSSKPRIGMNFYLAGEPTYEIRILKRKNPSLTLSDIALIALEVLKR